MRISRLTLGLVLASSVAGAVAGLWPSLQGALPEPARVTLAGRVPGAALDAWLSLRARQEAEREVVVSEPDGAMVVSRSALGLSLDVDAARAELSKPRGRMPWLVRLRVALGAPPPEPLDIAPSYRFDASVAASWLQSVAPGLHREAIDARLDLAGHRRVEAASGRELSLGATLAKLAALGDADTVSLSFIEIEPAIKSSALADIDPSLVLSQYETDFAKRGGPRVKNIALAARYLDGTLMAPGELWSFNRTVGARTAARGFVDAPVIVADELEPGIGGGVCQVASTLFAAAVTGGLEVVRRRSHSRPSGYAPLGLDATVIDGEVDLQLRNPYPVSVVVHAFLPVPTRLRVELLGTVAPGKIEHSYAVIKSEDFFRRIAERPELRPDQIKRQQKGSPGYDVVSTVRTRYLDGSERVRRYSSTYYPVPEIYWIGSQVDVGSLPPLPERATHSELSGDADPPGSTTPASAFTHVP